MLTVPKKFAWAIIVITLIIFGFVIYSVYARTQLREPYSNFPPPCPTPDCTCGPNCVIEEEGKIAVARLPHTVQLVRQFGAANVKISALEYKYISDEAYVKRLIGEHFGDVECIILVDWPGGSLAYIEVKAEEVTEEEYKPVPRKEFDEIISKASPEDRAILNKYMNDDQTHVRRFTDLY